MWKIILLIPIIAFAQINEKIMRTILIVPHGGLIRIF